jgi:hypothetical protein
MAAIIVNISPSTAQFDDTLFSLQFAAEAVECSIRTGDVSEDDTDGPRVDLEGDCEGEDEDEAVDARALAETEARIRREVHEEMNERLHTIQNDYQVQVEQIRSQSAQPFATKLQQALAQRMQKDERQRELEECIRERDREGARADALEAQLISMNQALSEAKEKLDGAVQANASLEGNIAAMIAGTEKLRGRHVQLQTDLQSKLRKWRPLGDSAWSFLKVNSGDLRLKCNKMSNEAFGSTAMSILGFTAFVTACRASNHEGR